MSRISKNAIRIAAVVVIVAIAVAAWYLLQPPALPDGFASSNGRIEAVEIDIASKTSGRVKAILAGEGDYVKAGQELAQMDTATLDAQLREAEANLQRAKIGVETAESLVTQRQAERTAAEAVIAQRQAELDATQKDFQRAKELVARDTAPVQQLDNATAALEGGKAAVSAAQAQLAASEAALSSARSSVVSAKADVDAVQATIERIKADIDDSTLRSPQDGRVQYKVAQEGEVIGAGGTILNLVDLGDVYMTFFLPTSAAGRIALGTEVRLVLDAAPQFVVPAEVSFVADVAQFTPKTVETADEREKLMFRVKARVSRELLDQYVQYVKTGLPGMAYVQLDPDAPWPDDLAVRLPSD